MTQNNADFTHSDIVTMYKINECLNFLRSDISKGKAITYVLIQAVEYMNNIGDKPVDDDIFLNVMYVIFEYINRANANLQKTYKTYNALYQEKRNVSFGGINHE